MPSIINPNIEHKFLSHIMWVCHLKVNKTKFGQETYRREEIDKSTDKNRTEIHMVYKNQFKKLSHQVQ